MVGMEDTPPPSPRRTDASRLPLDGDRVAGRLAQLTAHRFASVTAVGTTGSTNTDLSEAFRKDAALGDRTAIVAEEQVTARGRLGRRWSAPAGAQTILSVLLRPDAGEVPQERFGELPLLVGVAVAEAARGVGVDAVLKWPNDVIVPDSSATHGYRKLAGILVEAVSLDPPAVVVGVGLNASVTDEEFAEAGLDTATSLTTRGATLSSVEDREALVAAELAGVVEADAAWRAGGAALEGMRSRYRALSATLGTEVRAELPGGEILTGTAEDLDGQGGLVLATGRGEGAGRVTVTAGDVVHLRPSPGAGG